MMKKLRMLEAAKLFGIHRTNNTWSWGGPTDEGNIILIVHYEDMVRVGPGRYRCAIGWPTARANGKSRPSNGYAERHRHIRSILDGTRGYVLVGHGRRTGATEDDQWKVDFVDCSTKWKIASIELGDDGIHYAMLEHPGLES